MNERAILHTPESKFCFAVSKNEVVLRLRISSDDHPDVVNVIYGGKYDFALTRLTAPMKREYVDRLFAYFTVKLTIEDFRLVYVFEIVDGENRYYYSEDGLEKKYDFELSYYNCFQYAYINDCDIQKPVKWMANATFYQIFVDRFNKGENDKDLSYINMKEGDLPTPKSFAGGDLKGITQKLPYLKKLGINAVYLTPVFESVSNHKYDIGDYYKIDEHFGSKADLKELVGTAHSYGLRVVLDAVFNHCSERLSQFEDVKRNGKNSPYYDWFIVKSDDPFEYECFGSCLYMPKFNTSNDKVCDFLTDIGVYWIRECDIDGWRLDVSDEVSHKFWRKFRNAVKSEKPDCVLIGENWHDANAYLHGDQFDSIMNYAFTKTCLDYYAFEVFDAKQTADKLNELLMRNTDVVNKSMLNLLDSHDTHRFLTRVGGNKNKLMSALALTYFFPGAPCIYYGTENAMEGGYDPDCRRIFDWDNENRPNEIKTLIERLTAIKRSGNLSDSKANIYARDNALFVERKGYRLIINQSENSLCRQTEKVIASNNYQSGFILSDGFVIEKI